jgi:hypothetical protein
MEFKLTKKQKAIIIGGILGDAHLEFNGYKGTRIQIKQCQKYKTYVFWLYNELNNLCKSPPNKRKDSSQWFFGTRYTTELTELRNIFYPKDKKIIPLIISELLNDPLSLAIWYMDDGTLDWRPKDHFAFSLSINCFSLREANLLSITLEKNFQIFSTAQNPLCRGKRYPKLYIGKKGRKKFLSTIQPYILECFNHKIPPL